jgi:hypothetical protein
MRRLHLPIQNPCHEDWTGMESDGESRRFCDVCTKNVHDISSMTEATARAVLADESAKGRVCVRYTLDAHGHIKFRPQTVEAPSLWRMTLAAAGMAMALLTGCADSEPDRIMHDKCVYEVGPWSFTAVRGEGTCPAVEPEPEQPMVMGELEAVIAPEPIREVKGDIGPPQEIEHVEEVMGVAPPMVEPPPPPPTENHRMGKIAAPADPPEIELMGDIAPVDEPCEPEREGPRRL